MNVIAIYLVMLLTAPMRFERTGPREFTIRYGATFDYTNHNYELLQSHDLIHWQGIPCPIQDAEGYYVVSPTNFTVYRLRTCD